MGQEASVTPLYDSHYVWMATALIDISVQLALGLISWIVRGQIGSLTATHRRVDEIQ